MASADDKNRVAVALDYLRRHNHYFRFDDNERVVEAAVTDGAKIDEIAAHVGNLRDLEKLWFYSTGLSDNALSHLAGLMRLSELWIDGSGFTSTGLAHLGGMSKLEDLYIKNARGLDLAAFACLAGVPSLRRLSLRGGSFAGFEYLFAGAIPGDPDFSITAEAYQTVGLDRDYKAFQEAFKLFPRGIVPHDVIEPPPPRTA
jgi:hypothetical protein